MRCRNLNVPGDAECKNKILAYCAHCDGPLLKGKRVAVFAPTDAAFAKIPKADLDALLKDKAKLQAVLTYHVVSGKVMSKDLRPGEVKTVQGSTVMISTLAGAMVNYAKVVGADVAADNGVIHAIDTVLMPQ